MLEGSAVVTDSSASAACCNGSAPASNGIQSDNNSATAKRVEDSSGKLETADNAVDVSGQLDERENKLHLVAELGNALLQENEELRLSKEWIAEEYDEKIEVHVTHHGCLSCFMLLTSNFSRSRSSVSVSGQRRSWKTPGERG